MASPLEHVCCARLPATSLPALAGLRCRSGVTVALAGGAAWVRWDAGDEAVLRRLLPLPGVELFARRGEHWHRFGDHLPAFGLPLEAGEALPLHRAIVPEPVRPEPPGDDAPAPARLALVRDDRARSATALRC